MKSKILNRAAATLAALIILFTAALAILPPPAQTAYAAPLKGEAANVHLVSPVSVAAGQNGFVIADAINGGRDTILHIFSAAGTSRGTLILNYAVKKILLCENTLYILRGTSVYQCTINFVDLTAGTISPTMTNLEGLIDFFVTADYFYFLRHETGTTLPTKSVLLYRKRADDITTEFNDHSYTEYAKGLTVANGDIYTYFETYYYRHTATSNPIFSTPAGATAIVSLPDAPDCFIIENAICNSSGAALITSADGTNIVSAFTSAGYAFVLTQKGLYRYSRSGGNYVPDSAFKIGKDSVPIAIPSRITDFALVSPTAYPANVLYAASATNHSAQCTTLDSSQNLLVLLYEGWEYSEYYLVLFEGKYGFIERGAATLEADSFIINSDTVSDDISQLREAASTAHIYSLPYNDSDGTFRTDNVYQGELLTLIKHIYGLTETNNNWYYVSYRVHGGAPRYGFINTALVTEISEVNVKDALGIYKVNPKITETVYLFADDDLINPVISVSGNKVQIASGTEVVVLDQNVYGSSLVQVTINNVLYTGYVKTDILQRRGLLTDYAALGIVLLLVAIGATVLFLIVRKRKKLLLDPEYAEGTAAKPKKRAKADEEESILP